MAEHYPETDPDLMLDELDNPVPGEIQCAVCREFWPCAEARENPDNTVTQ